MMTLSRSSSAGHRRRAKPPGRMGPPSVMGLSVGRDVSLSPPDESTVVVLDSVESGFLQLLKTHASGIKQLCRKSRPTSKYENRRQLFTP